MENQIKINYFQTPVGELILGSFEGKLCLADWRYRKMRSAIDKRICTSLKSKFVEGDSQVLQDCKSQLNEYFENERVDFDIPLLFVGTEFQKQVWDSLLQVPYGKSETYLGLSKILGNEKAIRAVATANGANAISIIVPCHRIIGSNGDLVGYAGGLPAKKKLLELEGALSTSQLGLF
jgi:methylated-DNA-[protein]-cysteine S-methyltransferase